MHQRRFVPLFALLLAVACVATAAASSRPAELPAGLTPADVSTGTLADLAAPLAGLDRFDGAPGAPVASTGLWRQMLFELRRGTLTDRGWPEPRALQRRALAAARPDEIPVAMIDAVYDRLRPTAPRDGTPLGPADLETARVFAAAALRPVTYRGGRVTLTFASGRDVGDVPRRLTVDPGDGGGWRGVGPDGRVVATYATSGAHVVRLRAVGADGAVREAAFTLEVAALQTPLPTDTLTVTATVPYDGAYGTGLGYVDLAPNHASLTNPVVVVEGFDLDDTMHWDELYALLNQENLVETLRADGFDAVVLDFTSATDPIQRNAFVLTELLAQVRALIGPDTSLAVIGASMGGLVSRYALGWLAQQGVDPGVRTWISFDGPQRGAVIPLGLQHWLDFFKDDSESAAFLLSRLDTPAARQMLLQHHSATVGTTVGPDPMRPAFVAALDSVGLPPCRRVAIACGSGTGQGQGFAPGDQIIRYEYTSFLVDITGNVWAVPDGTAARIFQGVINQIWPLPDTYQDVNVSGAVAWDAAPGGWRSSMAQMDTTSVPYGDIQALYDNHCFIPTVSALDLEGVGPYHDVIDDPDLMSRTSFDVVHVPTGNQEHVSITPESAAWFLDEVERGVVAVGDAPRVADARLRAAPNPFNPRTTVSFDLARRGRVRLDVYDLRGRRVATLVDETLDAGRHAAVWDGRGDGGRRSPAGDYLLRLTSAGGRRTVKVSLVQ